MILSIVPIAITVAAHPVITWLGWFLVAGAVFNSIIDPFVGKKKGPVLLYSLVDDILRIFLLQTAWWLGPWWALLIAWLGCVTIPPAIFVWLAIRMLRK